MEAALSCLKRPATWAWIALIVAVVMFQAYGFGWSQNPAGGTQAPDPSPTGGVQAPQPDPFPGPPSSKKAYPVAKKAMKKRARQDYPGWTITETKLSRIGKPYRERWRAFCGYVSMESPPADDPSIGTAAVSTEYRVIVRRLESTGKLRGKADPSTEKPCVSPRP